MKHHFADLLDRDGDYWTIIPNRERYSYSIGDVPKGSKEITIVTISKDEEYWERIFSFPNLVEITLHEPSKNQLEELSKLTQIQRVRITHARPENIDFLKPLINIEELVLEYVSGFSDLSPLKCLIKLKSLHLENLRRVKDFSGLIGIQSLRYLFIEGTFDWKQPISNFKFLEGLPQLEVLSLDRAITKEQFPAFLPMLSLKKLKRIAIGNNMFSAKEYALLSVGLNGVDGSDWEAYRRRAYSSIPLPKDDIRSRLSEKEIEDKHPEVRIIYTGEREIDNPEDLWFEFIGKGAGRVKQTSKNCRSKCSEYHKEFEQMKEEAKTFIKNM